MHGLGGGGSRADLGGSRCCVEGVKSMENTRPATDMGESSSRERGTGLLTSFFFLILCLCVCSRCTATCYTIHL